MSFGLGASQERRPKILVIDDDEVCRAIARVSLEQGGFDVIELENPLGMSGIVNTEKPDVVLVDVEMPGMGGEKAVEIFLKHRLHDCKILLYSGRDPHELEKLARACGANGSVSKSVRDDAFTQVIRAHLVD